MTEQDKELLFNDLCARLPYGVIGKCEIDASYDTSFDTVYQLHRFNATLEGIKNDLLFVTPLIENEDVQEYANEEVASGIDILDFKPYLRPLSSMTEEEKLELSTALIYANMIDNTRVQIDWLNKNMFDYRGLIPKDCAIEVTGDNDPYKQLNKN